MAVLAVTSSGVSPPIDCRRSDGAGPGPRYGRLDRDLPLGERERHPDLETQLRLPPGGAQPGGGQPSPTVDQPATTVDQTTGKAVRDACADSTCGRGCLRPRRRP